MNKTHTYLLSRFKETNWPYYDLLSTKYLIGEEQFEKDIKELRDKDMVKPAAGINGWLIELIDTKNKWL